MSIPSLRRVLMALMAATAVIVGVLGGASSASANTLYACVKKSGSAHVYAKKPKCKKGESKLSWNTKGAAGSNGANGKNGNNGSNGSNGSNGANGAGPGFGAVQTSELNITNAESFTQVPGLTKSLPVGNFIAAGNVEVVASSKNEKEEVNAVCEMVNTPTSGAPLVQEGRFESWTNNTLIIFIFIHVTAGEIPFHMAIANTVPSTLAIKCAEIGRGEEVTMTAAHGAMVAVQVSALG